MWYEFFKAVIFRPLVRFGFKARITGAENLPKTGGGILASNHIAIMDSIVIPAMVPRKLTFPAKAELFHPKGGIGPRIVAWFLKAIGTVPMDRGGGRASVNSLDQIAAVLRDGHLIAIFPKVPAHLMAAFTRVRRGWPGWRWPTMFRSIQSELSARSGFVAGLASHGYLGQLFGWVIRLLSANMQGDNPKQRCCAGLPTKLRLRSSASRGKNMPMYTQPVSSMATFPRWVQMTSYGHGQVVGSHLR